MDKEEFASLKKSIKAEHTNGQRLQSLRLPRDLNLSGSKFIKKQFVPNLNVTRRKDKIKDVDKKIDQKQSIVKVNTRQHRQNNIQRYAQSSGIFSEGGALSEGKNVAKRFTSRENDVAPTMTVPRITKNSWEFNKKNEENVFEQIMADEEDIEDEKSPFQMVSWNEKDFKKVVAGTTIKSEMKSDHIKSEPDLPMDKLKLEHSNNFSEEFKTENEYSDHNPFLTLWGLPDSFAGKCLSDDPNHNKVSNYTLQDMPEGQIGKIILRKSGQVEVCIGRMKYVLERTEFETREEVVTLKVKENQEPAAAVLGKIQNRYLLNPDWDALF